MALPIHHQVIGTPVGRRRTVGQHEAPEHPAEREARRAQGDREAAGRAGRADLVRGQAAVDRVDAGLHRGGEVAHEDRGDVGDHAAAVLRGGPGHLQVLGHVDPGAAAVGDQAGGDQHPGLAAALVVGAGGVHHDPLGRVIAFLDFGGTAELELDRPHAHGDPPEVSVLAEFLGQLGARQAGRDLVDVFEEPPDPVNGLRDVEAALDQHQAP
jgi:hypothetical protein